MPTYYGVMFNSFDKSVMKFKPKEFDYKPEVEHAGISGSCKWFKNLNEQIKFTKWCIEQGYKLEE